MKENHSKTSVVSQFEANKLLSQKLFKHSNSKAAKSTMALVALIQIDQAQLKHDFRNAANRKIKIKRTKTKTKEKKKKGYQKKNQINRKDENN